MLTCTHKLAHRAIRFKYHDRLQQRPISFQSATPETAQNDEHFYVYRRSVVLIPIIGSTRSMQGADTRMHTRLMCQRVSKNKGLPIDVSLCFYYFQHAHHRVQQARDSRLTYLFSSTTFNMCIAVYKKEGAPDRRIYLLLLLSACASPRTKSKGLSINVHICFYYFQYVHHHVQKVRCSQLTYLSSFITFSTRITTCKK
jgi:hypothetical protein